VHSPRHVTRPLGATVVTTAAHFGQVPRTLIADLAMDHDSVLYENPASFSFRKQNSHTSLTQ